jgi:heme/copper-type cytochrome/quinol oxidase subunit 2
MTALQPSEPAMHALKDLLTTDVGLMSLAVIAFTLGMGVYFVRYLIRHMKEDAEKAAAASRP